jgi:ketosteroid isomerase-like protein
MTLGLFDPTLTTDTVRPSGVYATPSVRSGSARPGPRHARLAPKAAVGDTQRRMTEESTTPDLVELVRQAVEAATHRDFDALMSFYAPDAVWDLSPMGVGTFEGRAAIRGFAEDWLGSYEDFEIELQEVLDLGNGVVFVVNRLKGRLAGSTGDTQLRQAWVQVWVDAMMVRHMSYLDIDEARAAAERLAQERADV